MLTSLTPAALVALTGFSRQPRWSDVDKLIAAEIEAWTLRLFHAQDLRQIGECQGRVLALQDLQLVVRNAPETMEKLGLRDQL